MVHRLLQASLNHQASGGSTENFIFHQNLEACSEIAKKCNEMTSASKKAQERSDVIWLCVYLQTHPIQSALGVVVSMGQKSFSVLVPGLGLESKVYIEEQEEEFDFEYSEAEKTIKITPKNSMLTIDSPWSVLHIKLFVKVDVRCASNDRVPIDVKTRLNGPWLGAA